MILKGYVIISMEWCPFAAICHLLTQYRYREGGQQKHECVTRLVRRQEAGEQHTQSTLCHCVL